MIRFNFWRPRNDLPVDLHMREMWVDVVPGLAKQINLRMFNSLPFTLVRNFYILGGLETYR